MDTFKSFFDIAEQLLIALGLHVEERSAYCDRLLASEEDTSADHPIIAKRYRLCGNGPNGPITWTLRLSIEEDPRIPGVLIE